MKNATPKTVALFIALAVTTAFLLISAIFYAIDSKIFSEFIIGAILIFLATYVLSLNLIEKFIYRKVKIIYKNILHTRLKKGKEEKLDGSKDILQAVNDDVIEWAQNQENEIQNLKTLEKYRREFLGNVSHELKTPLFNIQGYILTLLEGGLEDPRINTDYLMRAQRSVDRMVTLVEDLDTISKIEQGQMHLNYESFDIVQLANEVIESEEISADNKKIELLIINQGEKSKRVYADRERIRQVLTNLIINSVKYGNENGYTKIKFFDMDENLLIEVVDNGIGIEEHHIPRLFERFYRVERSRSRDQGGSGLGLAIVKHIIEAHGQTINARSTAGKGSVFSFTLKKMK